MVENVTLIYRTAVRRTRHLVGATCWSALPGAAGLPGCRVAGCRAGLLGCCRVVAGLGCRVAGARAQLKHKVYFPRKFEGLFRASHWVPNLPLGSKT